MIRSLASLIEQVITLVLMTLKTKVYASTKVTRIGVATIQVDAFKCLKPVASKNIAFSRLNI